MKDEFNMKEVVRQKYSELVLDVTKKTSCCGETSDCCGSDTKASFSDDYSKMPGYNPDADYDLGCGIPTAFAGIRKGHTILDLGSGAGNDCFVARALTGETGKVIGLDFTEAMIEKAKKNNVKLGYKNIEFILGDIENMPLLSDYVDVVISNCVLNLVPDKSKAFKEIYRVLRKDGHFCISDIVINGALPERLKQVAALYAGCISGALPREEYLNIIQDSGFKNIQIVKEKKIILPDEILLQYLSQDEINELKNKGIGITSITVIAEKQ